jgi:hypothetical protein
MVSEQGAGRRVAVSADDITNVVQIACDRGQFLMPGIVFQQPHDIASDAGDKPDMPEAMLCEPKHPESAIGLPNVGLNLWVIANHV